MNERLITIPLPAVYPGAAAALGDAYAAITLPFDVTILEVSAAPSADDTGLTLDINDDGSGVITALACATKATPGTWKSIPMGGTNTPVTVAAGSVITFDANSAANGTQIIGFMTVAVGSGLA
jgi:hypothetical protein